MQLNRRARMLMSWVLAATLAAGCATTASGPPATNAAPADNVDLAAAVTYLATDLTRQVANVPVARLVIDPLLERTSGQQTSASLRVQNELMTALQAAITGTVVSALDASAAEQTGMVATGTVATGTAADEWLVRIALTDRASGIVVAQSAARFRQADLERTPTAFYSDSPSLVRDRSVDGYLTTAETPAGRLADPLYVEQLPTSALIAAALAAYNAGDWQGALSGYTAAAARENGQNLRTFNGLYLTNMRLGRAAAAEEAFGRIVALGLATNNLAVKLLFRTNSTDFLADPALAGVYPMWLRQIARTASASNVCLTISGHTSASGRPEINDPLSLARATAVRTLLVAQVPTLEARFSVTGMGARRNLVGTGADDASDAIDRRVEFEVRQCGPS